ncbi:bifunctional DNA primase/polymerase [Streptomyces sp. NPDC047117]|uniref:bifunctional DNA primase/polymerase n=1 Tax=Streptomyces sp. NPDC047117 TaxID=3155379 RepID=UPI003411313C
MTTQSEAPRSAQPGGQEITSFSTPRKTGDFPAAQAVAEPAVSPYAAGWRLYREAGWVGTLRLPFLAKKNPPKDFTGRDGDWPTDVQCAEWAGGTPSNIGIRLPRGVVGIDVDHYTKHGKVKLGADRLAEMVAEWGELPPTWSSTRREPDSPARIYLFRVPEGVEFETNPTDDIEAVQFHHRYMVAWPSVVPDDDDPGVKWQYAWYGPGGQVADRVPRPDELAELPQAWVDGLRKTRRTRSDAPQRKCTEPQGTRYGLAALKNAVSEFVTSPDGCRNDRLNKVGFNMGRLVGGGELNEAHVRAELEAAAFETGMDYGEDGILPTIESGVSSGKQCPRSAPDKTKRYEIPLKDGASNIRNLREAINCGAIPDLYVQNGVLVKVFDRYGSVELPQGESEKAVTPLTNDGLGNEMADHIFFYKKSENESGETVKQPKQPRQEVLRVVLGNRSWPGVPSLRGITRVPILRADGTVLNAPGYDTASGMYFDPMCAFDDVPDEPTGEQVDYAFDFVYNKVLGDFPYASQADRANAFAYATHATGRRFLEGASDGGVQPTPGANIVAGSQGTGKSYLAKVPLWTAGGTEVDYSTDEHELSKTLVSSLYNKRGSVIILDNVPDGYLVKNTTLARFLTSGLPDARILGQTKNIRMINDMFWVLTGNGTRLSDDNRRRFFDIELDVGMANPAMRDSFVLGDLESFFQRDRRNKAKFIWCCLILWRAWVAKGAQETTCAMRGSYGWWAKPTAGFLEFLGVEGFMDNYDPGASAEAEHWVPFLAAWHAKYGRDRLKVNQLMRDHIDNGANDGWDGSFMLPTNVSDRRDVRTAGDILSGKVNHVWGRTGEPSLVLRKASRSGSNTYWVELVGYPTSS